MIVVILGTVCTGFATNRHGFQKSRSELLPFQVSNDIQHPRFVPILQAECDAFEPPRLISARSSGLVRGTAEVDLIVATNGVVEDPVVLESSDPKASERVIGAVSEWRYLPAKCDGYPIEAEGRIKLGLRN
jgi:hypothetical protein